MSSANSELVSSPRHLWPHRRALRLRRDTDAAERVYSFVATEVAKGRQAYIVCPLVEESETRQTKAAQETFEHLSQNVFPNLNVGLLHGRMEPQEKEDAMDAFQRGETQVLVSTTVSV